MVFRHYAVTLWAGIFALCALSLPYNSTQLLADENPSAEEPVSFSKQIAPLFQAHCYGCHQPAKAQGGYDMTSFENLLKGGKTEIAAVVPGNIEESILLEMISPMEGEAQAEMPKGKPALHETEIALIKTWIAQGAKDDSPENRLAKFDSEHPPLYSLPPVITSLDISPNGDLIAIAGFHEVLLVNPQGELVSRLVGMSERINSVAFDPEGKRLVATGGLPARLGEIQVWDVAEKKLLLSKTITYDTLFGGSWSHDGKLIAFGCTDKTVRAIDAETGEQVLFQGAHDDWVRDTVFSHDSSHLISAGRDMTCKLTEVATERFVDNITSITPGVLKGGIASVARHPERDEIVIGGADGIPKVYRVHRLTKRVIGDDANLIRQFPAMMGRIQAVAVSADGKRIVAGSALAGKGAVHVYSYEFDTALPDDLKPILEKVAGSRNAEENKKVDEYRNRDVKQIAAVPIESSGIYAVDFFPDGSSLPQPVAMVLCVFMRQKLAALSRSLLPLRSLLLIQLLLSRTISPIPISRKYHRSRKTSRHSRTHRPHCGAKSAIELSNVHSTLRFLWVELCLQA
ncbi:MAG: c-type cytochrome domain-containing protein [Planctomycetaceae bacterium]